MPLHCHLMWFIFSQLDIGYFSGLFHLTLISQIILYLVGALILMPWSLHNAPQIREYPLVILFTLLGGSLLLSSAELFNPQGPWGLLLSSLVPIKPADDKPRRLTKEEKEQFSLTQNQEEMVVGLLLGDLYARKFKGGVNACLEFKQGIIHEDYLLDLYERFKELCPAALRIKTKILNPQPDKRTGRVYSAIYFNTYSLPCFNKFYILFYPEGRKIVPLNIGVLLTPVGLAFLISDDGSFNKKGQYVVLCTDSFTKAEVTLLANTLNAKWNLECYINKTTNGGYRIVIPRRSLPKLQGLLKNIMPPMMLHKIGL